MTQGDTRWAAAKWIDGVMAVCLLAMAPLFLFPQIRFVWVYAIAAVLLLVRGAVKRAFLEKTALDAAVCLLLLMLMASCYAGADVTVSLGKIAGLLFGALLFYAAVALMKTERTVWLGLQALMAVGIGLALIGVVDMDLYPEFKFGRVVLAVISVPRHHWNLPGAEAGVSANALAGVLLLAAPLVLVMLWGPIGTRGRGAAWLERLALLAGALVLVAVVFLSQSYSAWIALPLSLWLIGLNRKWKLVSLMGALVVGLSIWTIDPLRESLAPTRASSGISVKIAGRYPYWAAGLDAMRSHPIFGLGLNTLRLDPRIGYVRAHAHNQFITTGAELGVPGLIAYLAMLVGASWMAWDVARHARIRWMRTAAGGLIAGQLAFHMFGLGDAIPLGTKVGVLFWVSLALIAAMHRFTVSERGTRSGDEVRGLPCEAWATVTPAGV